MISRKEVVISDEEKACKAYLDNEIDDADKEISLLMFGENSRQSPIQENEEHVNSRTTPPPGHDYYVETDEEEEKNGELEEEEEEYTSISLKVSKDEWEKMYDKTQEHLEAKI